MTTRDVCRGTRDIPPAAGSALWAPPDFPETRTKLCVQSPEPKQQSYCSSMSHEPQWQITCMPLTWTGPHGRYPGLLHFQNISPPAQAGEAFLLMLLGLRHSRWELIPGTTGSGDTCTNTHTPHLPFHDRVCFVKHHCFHILEHLGKDFFISKNAPTFCQRRIRCRQYPMERSFFLQEMSTFPQQTKKKKEQSKIFIIFFLT